MTTRLADSLPPFDCDVPPNGYRWWYVDGLSDCGRFGVVIIGFVGSVFSPYYFRARQRGAADPENHCAINVALYSPSGKTWAMTERGSRYVTRSPSRLAVARSEIRLGNEGDLIIRIDDRSVPWARRMKGTIRVAPGLVNRREWQLDEHGEHCWQPVAPSSRIAVDFELPAVNWQGEAYVDSNAGSAPLESAFSTWDWSRCRTESATHIRYRAVERSGSVRSIALRQDSNSGLVEDDAEPLVALEPTGWGIARSAQSHRAVQLSRTLEDTPFYARSVLHMQVGDESGPAVHETLSLERFRKAWVRTLLPFRMPRLG